MKDQKERPKTDQSETFLEPVQDPGQPKSGLSVSDILEALPFYALLIDEQHHILQANRAVLGQFGLEPAAIVGKYCPQAIHGLDKQWEGCPLEEAVEKEEPVEREALDLKSGRWIRSAIYPTRSPI